MHHGFPGQQRAPMLLVSINNQEEFECSTCNRPHARGGPALCLAMIVYGHDSLCSCAWSVCRAYHTVRQSILLVQQHPDEEAVGSGVSHVGDAHEGGC